MFKQFKWPRPQCVKGTHFVSAEHVKAETAEILKSLTEHDLQNCFEHWQHLMQLCTNSEGNYFEGDHSWFPEFVKEKDLQAQSRFFNVGPRIVICVELLECNALQGQNMRKYSTVCLYGTDLKCGMMLVICLGKHSKYNLLSTVRNTPDLVMSSQENIRCRLPDAPTYCFSREIFLY